MRCSRLLLPLVFMIASGFVLGQTQPKTVSAPPSAQAAKATAAYAEVALKRADVEAELEALLIDYTDDFPKVKELKYELSRIEGESVRLNAIKAAERDKATAALGKLMVRKVEAEVDLWKVQQDYADAHPEVKRAKKKVEIFEKAIKEILG